MPEKRSTGRRGRRGSKNKNAQKCVKKQQKNALKRGKNVQKTHQKRSGRPCAVPFRGADGHGKKKREGKKTK